MKEILIKRLGNLLCIKSLVTLTLTGVFAYMAVKQTISQEFMTVYAVVIAFYFGTQAQNAQSTPGGAPDGGEDSRRPADSAADA